MWCIFSFAKYGTLPKHTIVIRMKGIRKTGRPRGRRNDVKKKDLKVLGIRNCHTVARDRKESRKILSEALVYNGL
jgi:hypothetical protein